METKYLRGNLRRLIYFFITSHGIPFVMLGVFMILQKSIYINNLTYSRLIYVGLLSPTIAAILILHFFYNKKERKEYWLRTVDFKRIPLKWYFVILAFPILIRLFASIIDAKFIMHNVKFNLSPDMTLLYGIFLLFFGPIPEELGWRGIALPELQKRFGFIKAVLFLGFMWALWHLPLFFIEGTYQYNLGLLKPLFWNFMFGVFFSSVFYGVIINETNGSILAVILFHYFDNLAGETFVMTSAAGIISTILQGILAIGILIYYTNKRA